MRRRDKDTDRPSLRDRIRWKWHSFLTWLGVCCRCHQVFSHDEEGPWAYCACGTTEWTSRAGLIPRLRGWDGATRNVKRRDRRG